MKNLGNLMKQAQQMQEKMQAVQERLETAEVTGSAGDDQRRVVTPPQAREWGVDFMVIGRPITRAENPTAAVDDILQSLS